MTILLFAAALGLALSFSQFRMIPGDKEVISPKQAMEPEGEALSLPADEPLENPTNDFVDPVIDPDNTPDDEPAETDTQTVAAQDDGLVDVDDEFGQTHRVTPHTAAYMRYAREQVELSRRSQQFNPTPPQPQSQPTLQRPAADAPEEQWQQYLERFNGLEQTVANLAKLQEQNDLSAYRQQLHQAGMSRLDSILTENPYLKANPRVAEAVKEDITSNLKNALKTMGRHVDPGSVAAAVYADATQLTQKYSRLVGTQAVKNAEVRKAAAAKSGPPAGGHAPAPTKGTAKPLSPQELNRQATAKLNKILNRS